MGRADFDLIWKRIQDNAGEIFHQKTGGQFRYRVDGGTVYPDRTSRALPRSQFQKAFERSPLRGPGELQDLQGPSYLWAVLTDRRIDPMGLTGSGAGSRH